MIATIKIKDLLKYLVGIIMAIFIVIYSTRYFLSFKYRKSNLWNINLNPNLFIKSNIILASYKEDKSENTNDTRKLFQLSCRSGLVRILDMELPLGIDYIKKEEANSTEEDKDITKEQIKDTPEDNKKEERVTTNIKDTYTDSYGTVKVKNLTKNIKLTEEILKPDYNVTNKKNIIIYHTHTCESYTQTEENQYKPSANFRTTDLNYTVVRVGRELKNELKKYGYNVIQSEEKHDYPAYTGSYSRSLKTIEKLLEQNKGTDILFDIHRDAVGSTSTYAPTVEIDGEKVAQLMFVIGTDDGGGKHPNWQSNLKFAVKVQQKANEMYPGLFRSINLRSSTFNQKIANAASIIEVGATGNTLEEATLSMKYLAEVINEVLK